MRFRLRPIVVAATCFIPLTAIADDRAAIERAVEEAFRPMLQEHDIPGMAVGVSDRGQSYLFSYGVKALGGKDAVTQDTVFEIGSVSKTFTATLGTYAAATGKLSLEDHPSRFMPGLKGSALDRASLLHLATYTAGGLPLQFPDKVGGNTGLETYFKSFEPAASPGNVRRYSNPSIGLFGHLAAKSLNVSSDKAMERELLPKLGLKRTYVTVPKAEMADYAWGVSKAGKKLRVTSGALATEAYGIKTSASDLLRFVELNMAPEALEAPLRQAIADTHTGYFRVGAMVQGLGWEQYPWPVSLAKLLEGNSTDMAMQPQKAERLEPPVTSGARLFNKTGSTGGFGAYALFVPDEKIGIVMLANRNFPNAARIEAAYKVLEALKVLRK